jgi:hypothetical protein
MRPGARITRMARGLPESARIASEAARMYQTAVKKLTRFVVRKSVFFLPEERQIAIERKHRGREQYGKLRQADCTIVSHGKSGRTWLRVMVSRLYQRRHGLAAGQLLSFDNLHKKNPAIPKIFFTHDNYLRDYTGGTDVRSDYGDRRIVFLARHPADVTVSQFFQWKFRMKRGKKDLLAYPEHGQDVSVFDFMQRPEWGLARVVDFMNLWGRDIPSFGDDLLLLRYEDLRADPERRLASLFEFLRTPATADEIRDAVEFGSIENMKRMEQQGSFWRAGGRMKPRDQKNPDSYKVRRAKVGGFRDYFTDAEVAWIEAYIDRHLCPLFGYTSQASLAAGGAPEQTQTIAG